MRLASHLAALAPAPRGRRAVGKQIEFLLQEIHREINTIGSKVNQPRDHAAGGRGQGRGASASASRCRTSSDSVESSMRADFAFERHGIIFIVSGPSGAGKSTLVEALLARVPELTVSVSCTHARRRGERAERPRVSLRRRRTSSRAGATPHEFAEWAEVARRALRYAARAARRRDRARAATCCSTSTSRARGASSALYRRRGRRGDGVPAVVGRARAPAARAPHRGRGDRRAPADARPRGGATRSSTTTTGS